MMARHHVALAGGVSAVVGAWAFHAGACGVADVPTLAAFVTVGAGSGILPDFDEPGSSAPHTLGPLGLGCAHLIRLVVRKHRGATHCVEVAAAVCLLVWWLAVPHPSVAGVPWVGEWLAAGHPLVTAIAAGLAVAIGADTLRGVSSLHALLAGAVVGTWVAFTVTPGASWPALAIFVGWVAHLIGDTPTPHGVPWSLVFLARGRCFSARLFVTGSRLETVATWLAVPLLLLGAWHVSGLDATRIANDVQTRLGVVIE